MRHQNWRDLQEWRAEGQEFSTTSNEASKLYDAVITQVMGWYDDPQLEGIERTLEKLLAADPNWVLPRALSAGLKLLGTGLSVQTDPELRKEVEFLRTVPRSKVNDCEYKHVQAVLHWAKGDLLKAAEVYEEILAEYPTDVLALKMVYDVYFYLGDSVQIRDCVARVLPIWEAKAKGRTQLPLKGYLHGMLAFGLEETNLYEKAEREARRGLEMNSGDAWSTHSLSHVFEMEGRTGEGISFLKDTVTDWTPSNYLACHNYWHLGLYHVERGELDDAIAVFDQQINPRAKAGGSMLDIVDATSLLYRLELAHDLNGGGAGDWNLSGRWADVYEICEPHLHDQILGFNDAHFMMSYLGAEQGQKKRTGQQLMYNAVKQKGEDQDLQVNYVQTVEVTTALLRAIIAYDEGKHAEVVEHMCPIRHSIGDIGGSHAQRDVFHQLLLCAAIKSGASNKKHKSIALSLLNERKCVRDVSPLTDRYTQLFKSKTCV